MVCVACVPRLPFFWAPTRAPSVASGTLLERFLGARDDVVRLLETLPDRAADRCAVLVTAATAAAAAAPTVAGLAPFSIDGESAGPIMSICSSVSAAAIPAPGDPMRSSAALRTVPRRCGGGVAVTGRPLSARTAAVRCGGRGTRGLGAWISVGVCESSRLMGASPPRDGCGLVSPGECSCLGRAFVTKFSTKPSRWLELSWPASAASKRWQNESFTTLARLDRLPVACC